MATEIKTRPPRVTPAMRANLALKVEALRLLQTGLSVGDVRERIGIEPKRWQHWRDRDKDFAKEVDALLGRTAAAPLVPGRNSMPEFDVFRDKYLHQPLFPLHYNIWDVCEGRVPRFLTDEMTYEPGQTTRVIVNVPPNHAKTTVIAIDYTTYLIHHNPGICIGIVSKTRPYAEKILHAVKTRLSSRVYKDMHDTYAPDPEFGWKDPDGSWTQTRIYVAGKFEGDTQKEPTAEAIGMGGQIYGTRFDVIILDDVIDSENASAFEKQSNWVMTEVLTRLPPWGGLLLILGTRLASQDLYQVLRDKRDDDDQPFFTYFSMPAVLEYGAKPKDWRTLWPYQAVPEGTPGAVTRCITCYMPARECRCLMPRPRATVDRWTGERLAKQRYPLGEKLWSLVWQQHKLPDDATFRYEYLMTSVDTGRYPGLLNSLFRPQMMEGLYVVGGVDPATTGHTAMIVMGLDRTTGKRWVLDGFDMAGIHPTTMREQIIHFTRKYGVLEWTIERNAFQKYLTDDPELVNALRGLGAVIRPHFTGSEKRDHDFGVMSLAPLFESTGRDPGSGSHYIKVRDGKERIVLPDPRLGTGSGWVSKLISQLSEWEPSDMNRKQKTDLVMALWFAEITVKKKLKMGQRRPDHFSNPYLSKNRLSQRDVLDLVQLRQEIAAEERLNDW